MATVRIEYRKRVVRVAYPRNGNVHNPTRDYAWDVVKDGKVVDGGFTTLRAAKEASNGHRAD